MNEGLGELRVSKTLFYYSIKKPAAQDAQSAVQAGKIEKELPVQQFS